MKDLCKLLKLKLFLAVYLSLIFGNTHALDKNRLSIGAQDSLISMTDTSLTDFVPLPISHMGKRQTLTNNSVLISGKQLERYPSLDLRNALKGLAPGLHIQEFNGSPGLSPEEGQGRYGITQKIGVSTRGMSMVYLIDDVPADITEVPLDPQEIESVTIVKDIAAKAMFGPLGAGGIVYIKTKRGGVRDHQLNVNLESGLGVVGRMPQFVSAAEYATLNNLAREQDGLSPLYSPQDISAYEASGPYDMYYPNVNFKDMMLKDTRPFNRVNLSTSGGGERVQYFSYLGYSGEGDIYKIGDKADYNRLNLRSNIDIKVNDVIDIDFDVTAGLSYRRSPNYRYSTSEGSSFTRLLEFNLALPEMNSTPPNAFPVYANNDPELGNPWFGVSSLYPSNPVGNLTSNGRYTETGRKAAIKLGVNYDASHWLKGLTSTTNISFDILNLIRIGTAEQYTAYTVTPSKASSGADTLLLGKFQDGIDDPQRRNLHDYHYQRLALYQKLDFNRVFDRHEVQSTGTYMLYRVSKDLIQEPQRFQSGIWTGRYTFDNKYSVLAVLNYTGTYSFNKENRNGLFPSMGLSWVASEEHFMEQIKPIDYLKIWAEAGILGYESFFSPFHYRDRWTTSTGAAFGPAPTGRWFGQNNDTAPFITYPSRIGNPNLTWETRKEYSIGIDAALFNNKLTVEANYYNTLRDGIIVQLPNSMPYIAGISTALPRFNHNQIRYYGYEIGLQYNAPKRTFGYSIGGNVSLPKSRIEEFDEPNYRYDYQFSKGRPVDAYWGHELAGRFQSDSETLLVPQLYDQELKAGDLKYVDMNGDGVIDENDRSVIGHTSPRLIYSIYANFNYKNFELFIMGTGRAFYDIPMTNSYYWNGWGDDNYSRYVHDNIDGDYPRLTYYKVNNNFVPSTFWIMKGDFFKIQNIELAYNVSSPRIKTVGFEKFRVFLRGANLLTISGVKDVDPESVHSGVSVYPLYRTFTAGVNIGF